MLKKLLFLIFTIISINLAAQGSFDIDAFTNPQKYGWKDWEDRISYRNDLFERQKLLQLYEMDAQSISGNILKSSMFPGWGQFNARSYTKGQVFVALEVALLGTSYFFYDKAMDNYSKYKNANQSEQIDAYYQDASVPYQYSLVFLTFAGIVWAYNIFDVVQTTEKYNVEVWDKTLKSFYNSPIQITPEGIGVRF